MPIFFSLLIKTEQCQCPLEVADFVDRQPNDITVDHLFACHETVQQLSICCDKKVSKANEKKKKYSKTVVAAIFGTAHR